MAQIGKASAKRSKPSYFMAILGVTIVLFFVGIFGWILINASHYIEHLKEEVQVQVFLKNDVSQESVDSLKNFIAAQPYTKSVEYINKETAKKIWLDKEADFSELLEENPLPASIDFYTRSTWVQKDSLAAIDSVLLQQSGSIIDSINYPVTMVEKMTPTMQWILAGLILLAIVFCILSIVLIDNTIRLAMYSNRFLIKTMQMVGATRGFISKPMNIRAIINGAIAALIAIVLIFIIIVVFESNIPKLDLLRDNKLLLMLFALLFFLGIGISLFSTHRSVIKYLKMSLDDLY